MKQHLFIIQLIRIVTLIILFATINNFFYPHEVDKTNVLIDTDLTVTNSFYQSPLILPVLMVKDEAHIICETLQPFVDSEFDSFFIFDTGSTDSTIAITKDFFNKNNIKYGIIEQEPFIDFSTSRNRTLKRTQEVFPNAKFMLMIDAEWIMHNIIDLVSFCQKNINESVPLYLLRILDRDNDNYVPRLIRCHSNINFVGHVHEAPNYVATIKAPETCYIERKSTRYGQEKSRARWKRDCELLLQDFNQDPTNERTVFYLAQTFECLNDLENARIWYTLRCNMLGWNEETYMARYRLARVYDLLGNWSEALNQYLTAFSLRPHRIEPLVCLAQHYWNEGNTDLCFLFALRAAMLPYPTQDLLFIEKTFYDFTRYDLLGRAAWYVKEYEIGEKAVIQALLVYPDLEYLHKNLDCYLQERN